MDRQRLRMLREIQELEFAAIEMNLYLDTHPYDEAALNTYNNLAARLAEARRTYEAEYGPLVNYGYYPPGRLPWQWIEEPWPWEIEY